VVSNQAAFNVRSIGAFRAAGNETNQNLARAISRYVWQDSILQPDRYERQIIDQLR